MTDTLLARDMPARDAETWTEREIRQQPETLRATQSLLRTRQPEIEAFLAPLLARPELRIILIGAGTSALIGDSLAPSLSRTLERTVEAVATTDIVSAPGLHLRRDAPILLVSFGRSGSSPESIAAVELADVMVDEVYHLIITCNPEGELARRVGAGRYVLVLPEATHDRAFAMTSSFSAMMLAALSMLGGIEAMDARLAAIVAAVEDALKRFDPIAAGIAAKGYERVVYLGSGSFKGLAHEAALKLLELSDGRVVTAFDTPLGFRHGPKTIINAGTLVIVFLSNDPLTRRYDSDLLEELRNDARCGAVMSISAQPGDEGSFSLAGLENAVDVDLLFPFIVPAQLIGLKVSRALGLEPDRPNASGTVTRVVHGVRIHTAAR